MKMVLDIHERGCGWRELPVEAISVTVQGASTSIGEFTSLAGIQRVGIISDGPLSIERLDNRLLVKLAQRED